MNYDENFMAIRTFCVKSQKCSFLRTYLEIPTKSVFLQQQIPPRLSTMRTTEGLRFLYGYMNYDKQPINIDEQLDLHAMGFPQGWENEPLWR